jgi:ligand-binding sensor domain-containing protein
MVFLKSDSTLLDSKINGITIALDGTVWISTDLGASYYRRGSWGRITDSGLVRLANTTWTKFTAENSPLPSSTVTALSYDTRGNIWIGTANGLGVYNENGINF